MKNVNWKMGALETESLPDDVFLVPEFLQHWPVWLALAAICGPNRGEGRWQIC